MVAPRLTNPYYCPDPILTQQHHPRSLNALGLRKKTPHFESTEEALEKDNQNDERHESLDDVKYGDIDFESKQIGDQLEDEFGVIVWIYTKNNKKKAAARAAKHKNQNPNN